MTVKIIINASKDDTIPTITTRASRIQFTPEVYLFSDIVTQQLYKRSSQKYSNMN